MGGTDKGTGKAGKKKSKDKDEGLLKLPKIPFFSKAKKDKETKNDKEREKPTTSITGSVSRGCQPTTVATPPNEKKDSSKKGHKAANKMTEAKKKRRRENEPPTVEVGDDEDTAAPKPPPAEKPSPMSRWKPEAVAAVKAFVRRYAEMGDAGIEKEYLAKVGNYKSDGTFRHFTHHKNRNRYADVVCLDETRVQLEVENPGEVDYIHANWVHDIKLSERVFIATQAPLERTQEEFWRMIHQHKCAAIIMICPVSEDDKTSCKQFWPNKEFGYINQGRMFVECKKIQDIKGNSVTTLEVLPEGCSNSQITYLVQFKSDFEKVTPSTCRKMLNVLRLIAELDRLATGPAVIFDVSGVTHAAVAMLTDLTLSQLFDGKDVDMPEQVRWLRRQRAASVLNGEQYAAIIKTVIEYANRALPGEFKKEYAMLWPGYENEKKKSK